ncbi:ribonuclease T2 [Massilia sp. W12]|uniref:ribonuclease T2 n=1 Tax=Massilia sp. W12 TaxID=3126507 RepID=UPI0030D23380
MSYAARLGAVFALSAVFHTATAAEFDYYLLAASWQPGFCKTKPGKPECANLAGSYAASNLVVHGLWPNNYDGAHPFYCGVSKEQIALDKPATWCSMANYGASSSTLSNLAYYMPGIQSCLDKHEWYKHGACDGRSADAYWNQTTQLVSRLGATGFSSFLRSKIGLTVSRSQLLNAFNNSFGPNSSAAMSLQCGRVNGVSYLTEVWINLNPATINQFPAAAALLTDGAISGTCPSSGIMIARP